MLKSNLNVYELIKDLSTLIGVSIGDYNYQLDGETIEGFIDYPTTHLMESHDFTPVVRVTCTNGWLEVQDTKGVVTKRLS